MKDGSFQRVEEIFVLSIFLMTCKFFQECRNNLKITFTIKIIYVCSELGKMIYCFSDIK